MYRYISRIAGLLCVSFFISTSSFAYTNSDAWRFQIAPYLWATSLNGNVGIGPLRGNVDESFTDLLSDLNVGGMLWLTAHKNNFGVYFNGLYAYLSDTSTIDTFNVKSTSRLAIYAAGVSYIALQRELCNCQTVMLEPYLGARYTLNNSSLKVDSFSRSLNKSWTIPLIGLQAKYGFNQQWNLTGFADVGGTSTSTNYQYNLTALLSYTPCSMKNLDLALGYRLLHQTYITSSGINYYKWNMNIFGPVLGVAFNF